MSEVLAPTGEFLLYVTEDGRTRVECRFQDENIWLTQKLMAELFQKDIRTINEHIQNILTEGELETGSVIRNFRITAGDGKNYDTNHYNLEMIIAVGYRVKSQRGMMFRQWATERLKEYLVKGFTMDDQRLKNPPVDGSGIPDYFDELLERIRDIRASEKRMYLRVREIFALAGDYNAKKSETTVFFQTIQNKLHYAATGKTAAEIIAGRADSSKQNMNLTSWKSEVVRKADVVIAKNYLNAQEIDELNRIVVMWLDYSEDQARRRKQVFLKDWDIKLEEFLKFNERSVLTGKGAVSHADAVRHAEAEYDTFAERRRALIEAEAERAQNSALEETAKALPAKTKKRVKS